MKRGDIVRVIVGEVRTTQGRYDLYDALATPAFGARLRVISAIEGAAFLLVQREGDPPDAPAFQIDRENVEPVE